MPRNRFTKSQKISEAQFIGMLYDFILGTSAARSSERIGVGVGTVRNYYKKLRHRMTNSPALVPQLTQFPSEDDPVWSDIEFCIFECPGLTDRPYKTNSNDINLYFSSKVKQRDKKLVGADRKVSCSVCKLHTPFEIDEFVKYTMTLHRAAMGGFGNDSFRNYYIENLIRARVLTFAGAKSSTFNRLARMILGNCFKHPL